MDVLKSYVSAWFCVCCEKLALRWRHFWYLTSTQLGVDTPYDNGS